MVIVTGAAIGAAGYGLYRGGEAGIAKGKQAQRSFQGERKRANQRSSLREKINARSSKIAELVQMKNNEHTNSGGNEAAAPRAADVNDRHRAVMEKLRQGRNEEKKKGGWFKKK